MAFTRTPAAAVARRLVALATGFALALSLALTTVAPAQARPGDPAYGRLIKRDGHLRGGCHNYYFHYRLKQAGVPFVVLEKDPDVGGTWWENTYPGCRVDVANHFYSYSFAQREDWPQHYSTQEVLLDYFRTCTDRFGLRDHIRFETEVTSAEWSEERGSWTLCLRTPQGETVATAGRGPQLTVTGEPGELLLFAAGRDEAHVAFDGPADLVERVKASRGGL